MKLDRKPHPIGNTEANVEGWWYENAKSIDVYLRDRVGGRTLKGRIRRAALEAWLQRSRPSK